MAACFGSQRNERQSTLFFFPPFDPDELEQPSCCQSIWQSIKDFFKQCFFNCQCIAGFNDESVDYFFDPQQLLPESEREEEDQTQNPNMETGTPLVGQLTNAQVAQNLDRERSDSIHEKVKQIAYMWAAVWLTEGGHKVAGTGADGSAVAETGVQGRNVGGAGAGGSVVAGTGVQGRNVGVTGAGGSVVARTGIDDSAAVRKDKGPSSSN